MAHQTSGYLFSWCVVLSLIAFALYRIDKSAARHRRWRVRESTLHMVAVLGGWPGALLAQSLFHHKTRKQGFQRVFWLSVFANIVVMAIVTWNWVSQA